MLDIRILGDSSSSGIGAGRVGYPHLLAQCPRLLARTDVRVLNYSVPGLTSADAAAFCHSSALARPFDALIVFLGNNERACTTRKGVARRWRRLLPSRVSRRRATLGGPLPHDSGFVFDNTPPTIRGNTPDEFRRNLSSVIGVGQRVGALVILVNPIANDAFRAGLFAANGLFFHHIGLPDAGALLCGVDPESIALVAAIRAYEDGRSEEARERYGRIAVGSNREAAFIARFNAAADERGARDCTRALERLLGVRPYYDAIVLDALAQVRERAGDGASAAGFRRRAYESDRSTYRIGVEYRDVVRGIADETGVAVVDLAALLEPSHFVDYCHPTAAGHRRIADALSEIIGRGMPPRESSTSGRYEDRFISPNAYFEDDSDLVSYYQIEAPVSRRAIVDELRPLARGDSEGRSVGLRALRSFLVHFLNSNDRHPAFNTELDLVGDQAPLGHEVLAFPEYYLHRLLYNYGREFDAMDLARRIDAESACGRLILRPPQYAHLVLRHNHDSLDMPLRRSRAYLDAILARLRDTLDGPAFANRIGIRVKTIRAWYTREAFRYGTHSRASMLHDRWALEQIAESVSIAAVVAAHNRLDDRLDWCGAVMRTLAELDEHHEHHAMAYCGAADAFSASAYERGLAELRRRVANLLEVSSR